MSKKHRDNLIWGLILVILGCLFLLENIGYNAWRILFKLWPLILIFWGASKLYYGLKAKSQAGKAEESPAKVEIVTEDKKDES
ncbi:MAG: LiaI-LiaF-like domain-containing protein [Candidatus Saccharicenans sp.]